jgi:predicted O-linked N-acetylglucosamine transferase (SPINDLY family)
VFCCFNNPCKISPTLFAAWMQILLNTPGSVLWLLAEDEQAPINLRRHALALGVSPERIVFAPRSEREAYLAKLARADLFLDTLPYNAGTTASDALWVGLPVLTQAGKSFAGRVAASLLKAVDMPELIATNLDEYVALAIQLAQQPERMAALRAKLIANSTTTRLFDTPAFTRSLESAFQQMHQAALAGQPPRDIHVS